jgi:hypothetical protein
MQAIYGSADNPNINWFSHGQLFLP